MTSSNTGIGHREKDPKQVNSLAVVDRAIGILRASMAKNMTDTGDGRWYNSMKEAVSAYNTTGHSHLMGSEPADVATNKELTYELKVQAGEDLKHNAELHDDKAEALKKAGAFRVMKPRNTWARAHQPSWGDKIHVVDKFIGPEVVDTEGGRYPVKLVLPVKSTTAPVEVPKEITGGRPVRTGPSTKTMQPYATILKRKLTAPLALQVAGRQMNEEDGFRDAMKEAKLIGIGSFKKFLDLFPKSFKVEGQPPKQRVRKA